MIGYLFIPRRLRYAKTDFDDQNRPAAFAPPEWPVALAPPAWPRA